MCRLWLLWHHSRGEPTEPKLPCDSGSQCACVCREPQKTNVCVCTETFCKRVCTRNATVTISTEILFLRFYRRGCTILVAIAVWGFSPPSNNPLTPSACPTIPRNSDTSSLATAQSQRCPQDGAHPYAGPQFQTCRSEFPGTLLLGLKMPRTTHRTRRDILLTSQQRCKRL